MVMPVTIIIISIHHDGQTVEAHAALSDEQGSGLTATEQVGHEEHWGVSL